jgi:hypothetical protein
LNRNRAGRGVGSGGAPAAFPGVLPASALVPDTHSGSLARRTKIAGQKCLAGLLPAHVRFFPQALFGRAFPLRDVGRTPRGGGSPVISMSTDTPSWAVACAGSRDVSGFAASGVSGMVLPSPATPTAPLAPTAHVTRQRRLAGSWSEHEGRSVFTGTNSLARKAEAHRRDVVMNGGYATLNDDIWDPDPWRSHPG